MPSWKSGGVRRGPEIGRVNKSDYVSALGQKTKKKFPNLLESPREMLKNQKSTRSFFMDISLS